MPKQKSKPRAAKKDDKKPRTAAAAKKVQKKTGGGRSTKKATATSKKLTTTASKRKLARLPAFLTASTNIDRLLATKEEWSKSLLRPRPSGALRSASLATSPAPESNVVGVGIGERVENGRHTGILAVKFLVRVKYGADQLTSSDRLPESIDGLPTDVEEVGTFRAFQMQDPQSMLRPSPPGCSVGFEDSSGQLAMAGTFGALVKRGTRRFILSNNHVLANENELAIGAPTFQPGFLDAGNPPSTSLIGTLSAFVELRSTDNLVDCAISEVSDLSLVTNSIIRIGVPQGVTQAQNSMSVHKFGRTTRFRVGFIDSTMMDVSVDYRIGTLTFRDQIIIKGLNGEAFSDDGDSGALVVERNTSRAVGLLFAGSSSHTIANHISDVFQALNVSLS